jgi:protein-tyrosine phosphatase
VTVTADAFTVLFVCTGNICRSPIAERLGRACLEPAHGAEADLVRIGSAGVAAVVGREMHPDSAAVLRGYGGDPSGFAARRLTAELVEDADLVLTMTRAHIRKVLRVAPRALKRTFTLREAAALLPMAEREALDGPTLPVGIADRVRRMSDLRSCRERGPQDDVPDPMGRPVEEHQLAGALIAEAVVPLLTGLTKGNQRWEGFVAARSLGRHGSLR